jgi:hypothetical protein
MPPDVGSTDSAVAELVHQFAVESKEEQLGFMSDNYLLVTCDNCLPKAGFQ